MSKSCHQLSVELMFFDTIEIGWQSHALKNTAININQAKYKAQFNTLSTH